MADIALPLERAPFANDKWMVDKSRGSEKEIDLLTFLPDGHSFLSWIIY